MSLIDRGTGFFANEFLHSLLNSPLCRVLPLVPGIGLVDRFDRIQLWLLLMLVRRRSDNVGITTTLGVLYTVGTTTTLHRYALCSLLSAMRHVTANVTLVTANRTSALCLSPLSQAPHPILGAIIEVPESHVVKDQVSVVNPHQPSAAVLLGPAFIVGRSQTFKCLHASLDLIGKIPGAANNSDAGGSHQSVPAGRYNEARFLQVPHLQLWG